MAPTLFFHRSARAAANEGRAATTRDLVVLQGATGDRGRAAQVVDGAAEVVEAHRRDGLIAAEVAVGQAEAGAEVIEDGAAAAPPVAGSKITAVVAWLYIRELSLTLRLAPASLKIAPPPRPPTA